MIRLDFEALPDGTDIARIILTNPERKNALNRRAWRGITDACRRVGERGEAVRLVLIESSVEGVFSAGADMSEFDEIAAAPALAADNYAAMSEATAAVAGLPMPTLALIDGACMGGALGLAVACDLRLASARSRFMLPPARLGLVYPTADMARLCAMIGPARARYMVMTARRVDAATALGWGLVDDSVAPDALAAARATLCGEIAALSPFSLRVAKAQIDVVAGVGGSPDDPFRGAFIDAFAGTDHAEGLAAFREKRPPRF